MVPTLDTMIKDLYDNHIISVRTYNVLRYKGFNTLRDIRDSYSDLTDLLSIRNFGRKCLYEIETVFKSLSTIEIENDTILDFNQKFNQKFNDLEVFSSIEKIICEAFESHFNVESSSLSLIKDTHSSGIALFFNLLSDAQYFFKVYTTLSYKENIKIRKSLILFLKTILESLEKLDEDYKSEQYRIYKLQQETEKITNNWFKFKHNLLNPLLELCNHIEDKVENFSYVDKFAYFFTPIQKELFIAEYQSALIKASVRTNNVANRYFLNIITVVGLLEDPIHSLSGNKNLPAIISSNKSRTKIELTQILLHLKDKFDDIFQLEESSIQMFSIKKDYPFLINSQRTFILEFEQEFGYKPYFYILLNYLRVASNDDRNIRIFCKHFGVLGPAQSLANIGNQENISSERVRQIIDKGIKNIQNIVEIDISKYKHIIDKQFFLSDDYDYLELIKRERLTCSFIAFGELLKIFAPFEVISFDTLEIIKSTNLFERKSLSKIIEHITKYNRERKAEDKVVPFTYFYPKINDREQALLTIVINYIDNPKILIYENCLIFKQTYIDTKLEIIKILEEHGEPMFLDEIFEQFKIKYPEHKYNSANQLRASMKPPIKAVGKQSKYGLDTWSNINWGSIRDILIECLEKSDSPMHIDELIKNVLVHYPNTNIKNIASTMSSDILDRFVQFDGGYYGLEERVYPARYIKSDTIVHRYKFDERLQMFKEFVDNYHRFPTANGGQAEASLRSWCYNVENGAVHITEEQFLQYNKMIQEYEFQLIPRNQFEIDFLNKCNDYKAFIEKKYSLPNPKEGEQLYYWFLRSKSNFDSFTDFRRHYFLKLLSYIASLGFRI